MNSPWEDHKSEFDKAWERQFKNTTIHKEHPAYIMGMNVDFLVEYIRWSEREIARLNRFTDTLAVDHPDAADMLFRERKLNETLLEMTTRAKVAELRVDWLINWTASHATVGDGLIRPDSLRAIMEEATR